KNYQNKYLWLKGGGWGKRKVEEGGGGGGLGGVQGTMEGWKGGGAARWRRFSEMAANSMKRPAPKSAIGRASIMPFALNLRIWLSSTWPTGEAMGAWVLKKPS